MTADPTPKATPDEERAVLEDDAVHLLSTYLHGVLTIHFDGDRAVTRDTSQFDARGFLTKQNEAESSDAVTWATRSWYHWASSRVVFTSFDADRDQTRTIRPADRRRLAKAGHDRGVVASLVDFWQSRDQRREPLYSIRVMVLLHQTALNGAERGTWEAIARAYEGERGAALLARAPATLKGETRSRATSTRTSTLWVTTSLTTTRSQKKRAVTQALRDPMAQSRTATRRLRRWMMTPTSSSRSTSLGTRILPRATAKTAGTRNERARAPGTDADDSRAHTRRRARRRSSR